MKYISFSFTCVCLFYLSACGLNTKFDDNDYRPVGASPPLNSDTHTLSKTRKVSIEKETDNEEIDSTNPTRYVRPNSEATKANTSTTIEDNSKSSATVKSATKNISTPLATSAATSSKQGVVSKTINEFFNSRYGDSDIVIKISKTVKIHCNQPQSEKMPSIKENMLVCNYQFPEYCGSHAFSLITNQNKQLLMFHDKKHQRNIIDTIIDNKQSTPGLWDKNDYVSSELLTVIQLISDKTFDTNHLGWIMNVSKNEKAQLGHSYSLAVNEASKCF